MFSSEGKFQAYVRQLHSQLDTTTVNATLILMMGEARAAIDKKRQLIALERLTQRHNSVSLNELQALENAKRKLSTALLREIGVAHDDMEEEWGRVVPLRVGASAVC
jgi:hypothetical protein